VLALGAAAAAGAAQQVERGPGAETGEPGRAVIRVTLPEEAPPAAAGDAASTALEALLPAEAAMVVLDAASGRRVRLHGEQAARPLPPCSTFKIPNTLIALGAGAVTTDDNFLPRDRERDPRGDFWSDAWDADQDLPSALRRSTVWYYQELARRVGSEEMQRQLDRLDYGNRDVSAGIDRFWLGGSLAISADEQVDFLRRLHAGDFGFPEEHLALLREGTLQEEGEAAGGPYALYAKTGACTIGDDDPWVGWWVGWVERPKGPAFFALNLTGTSYREIAPRRIPLARAVLGELGLLPPPG
jgi:beta-lactamase class D